MKNKLWPALLLAVLTTTIQAANVPGEAANKCLAGKNKCVSTLVSALMACRAQCEGSPTKCGQKQTDCEAKAKLKFDGGVTPEKGCFAKLEAKQNVAKPETVCTTTADTSVVKALAVDLVAEALAELGDFYGPSGVQTNVPVSDLQGWIECHKSAYNSTTSMATVQAACTKAKLMLACRPTDSATLTVLAWAPRTDVLFDTNTSNTPHNANGVGWYYSSNYSWGFAPQSASIIRSSCDVQDGLDDQRLCWHTNGGNFSGGYSCGENKGLNSSTSYERIIYQAD